MEKLIISMDKGMCSYIRVESALSRELNSFVSVEGYVNDILSAHKLRNAGLKLDEERFGFMMLAGLLEEYRPMITGIQSSAMKITSDCIILELEQVVQTRSD